MRRQTLKSSATRSGVGVHTGAPAEVVLEPSLFGSGIQFFLDDGVSVPVGIDAVSSLPGATVLVSNGRKVHTPEHLLAALVGLGITDARLTLLGPEVPILDGSALPWCEAIQAAGVLRGPEVPAVVLDQVVRVEAAGGWAEARPSARRAVTVTVDFDDPGLPRGEVHYDLDEGDFMKDLALARTFVLERDVARALAAGLGKGANDENTVLWTATGARGPLRCPDEAVRHKLLDLIGDLALVGAPLQAEVHVVRGSHRLHHALIRAVCQAMKRPASQ
ncbi:MAG: UDP-3-O-[3-hydroxymyristoyl] N-acetylglucosamine deacetylase [Rhodobacterales bacterium]|nr:UDP-3-O-[3-hydroxymyristoyl] N-acetylglucosamine deacetylase [Rhodobacterales bacterium]